MSDKKNKTGLEYLLARCVLRDTLAFEKLYNLTSPKLFAVVLRIVVKQEWAEDVLQEAYISVWNNADQFRSDKASAMTWMTRIVRNKAIDYIRRKPNRDFHSEDDLNSLTAYEKGPLDNLYSNQEAELLRDCLNELEQAQQNALVMAYYQGLTHLEMAQALAKPLGTIKSWIRRGLLRLKGCLEI